MPQRLPSVSIRPFRRWDRAAYVELRQRNAAWLDHWEARDPELDPPVSRPEWTAYYHGLFRALRDQHRLGHARSFAILADGALVGHLTFAPILWGATLQSSAGYWVSERHAGRQIAPRALALGIEEMIHGEGLHRIEVLVQSANVASLAVVAKVGLRPEGIRRGAIFVDGAWRDHEVFAITAEDVGEPGEFSAGVQRRSR
ncbi:MAG: GNAT family protein [Dermabacter sp.]|nr:GNAT family protein [Dermabacter sp.]